MPTTHRFTVGSTVQLIGWAVALFSVCGGLAWALLGMLFTSSPWPFWTLPAAVWLVAFLVRRAQKLVVQRKRRSSLAATQLQTQKRHDQLTELRCLLDDRSEALERRLDEAEIAMHYGRVASRGIGLVGKRSGTFFLGDQRGNV